MEFTGETLNMILPAGKRAKIYRVPTDGGWSLYRVVVRAYINGVAIEGSAREATGPTVLAALNKLGYSY